MTHALRRKSEAASHRQRRRFRLISEHQRRYRPVPRAGVVTVPADGELAVGGGAHAHARRHASAERNLHLDLGEWVCGTANGQRLPGCAAGRPVSDRLEIVRQFERFRRLMRCDQPISIASTWHQHEPVSQIVRTIASTQCVLSRPQRRSRITASSMDKLRRAPARYAISVGIWHDPVGAPDAGRLSWVPPRAARRRAWDVNRRARNEARVLCARVRAPSAPKARTDFIPRSGQRARSVCGGGTARSSR